MGVLASTAGCKKFDCYAQCSLTNGFKRTEAKINEGTEKVDAQT
jgi:hypothetical protein